MLSVKQGGIKYHFLSLWHDSAWDWISVSWAIDEHSTRYAKLQWYLWGRAFGTQHEELFSQVYFKVIKILLEQIYLLK